jgi:hypothetical protein
MRRTFLQLKRELYKQGLKHKCFEVAPFSVTIRVECLAKQACNAALGSSTILGLRTGKMLARHHGNVGNDGRAMAMAVAMAMKLEAGQLRADGAALVTPRLSKNVLRTSSL